MMQNTNSTAYTDPWRKKKVGNSLPRMSPVAYWNRLRAKELGRAAGSLHTSTRWQSGNDLPESLHGKALRRASPRTERPNSYGTRTKGWRR
jgi:hypothetical protein